jgi:hypothetical protein
MCLKPGSASLRFAPPVIVTSAASSGREWEHPAARVIESPIHDADGNVEYLIYGKRTPQVVTVTRVS